jgi:Raf kinase inhibitor-like YbhB/YbcL family protein
MKLTSKTFNHNESIPRRFTCQGDDLNPQLSIAEIPEKTQSLALVMEDPDAPGKTFDHWILYDIPPSTNEIAEGASAGTAGINDFGKTGYGGPCPPSGTHRYFFKVYALDKKLDLREGLDKYELQAAMQGHILDRAEMVGLYAKQ